MKKNGLLRYWNAFIRSWKLEVIRQDSYMRKGKNLSIFIQSGLLNFNLQKHWKIFNTTVMMMYINH